MKNNQNGVSAVEGLLILIIVGLLGFVGWYVWSSNNKAKDSLANADRSSSVATKSPVKTQAQLSDKELITKAVTKDCEAIQGNKVSGINVYKQQGDYAAVTLACGNTQNGSPTSRVYLKKASGDWTIVVRGGGAPTTNEDLKPYGFPSNFLD